MLTLIILGLATASISITLTSTPVFEWVKELLVDWPWTLALWNCPYCMAHWIGLGLALVFRPLPITGTYADLFPVWFAIVMIAALFIVVQRVLSKVSHSMDPDD